MLSRGATDRQLQGGHTFSTTPSRDVETKRMPNDLYGVVSKDEGKGKAKNIVDTHRPATATNGFDSSECDDEWTFDEEWALNDQGEDGSDIE